MTCIKAFRTALVAAISYRVFGEKGDERQGSHLSERLSDLMKAEPVVLLDTSDPAIYAKAHIPGAVDKREVFTKSISKRSAAVDIATPYCTPVAARRAHARAQRD